MTGPATVTQADREAAKSLLGRDDAGPSWWSIDSGNADNDRLVQAFARHRLAAEERGARMALEAAAKVAEIMGSEWNPERSKFDAVRHDEAHGIATAIRQTDPAQIVKGQSDG